MYPVGSGASLGALRSLCREEEYIFSKLVVSLTLISNLVPVFVTRGHGYTHRRPRIYNDTPWHSGVWANDDQDKYMSLCHPGPENRT